MFNKEIVYIIRKPEINEAIILFKSYFPMNKEEVLVSLFYEGFILEEDVIVDRITEENFDKFEKLDTCKIVTNMNDR